MHQVGLQKPVDFSMASAEDFTNKAEGFPLATNPLLAGPPAVLLARSPRSRGAPGAPCSQAARAAGGAPRPLAPHLLGLPGARPAHPPAPLSRAGPEGSRGGVGPAPRDVTALAALREERML